ncbi:MAG: hypothetical protein BroJett030_01520 [Alphaproteobacteria bacterium]|nr:MAG: hypothetical protein BroJett030_01520 [Alphaproteobacteria bacterium]
MPGPAGTDVSRERELVILEACRKLADELALVEPADYVCLLQTGNVVTLADLVASSIEPFFDASALTFAWSGECRLSWSEAPVVALDFEFLHDGVSAFFRLILSHAGPDVELNHVSFDRSGQTPADNTARLADALASAAARRPQDPPLRPGR